jgi:hypothetical protein
MMGQATPGTERVTGSFVIVSLDTLSLEMISEGRTENTKGVETSWRPSGLIAR